MEDDSTVTADEKVVRPVTWYSEEGSNEISLSESLAAPDTSLSLLSVSALVKKGFNVYFMPWMASRIDTEDRNTIITYATQGRHGLFYISDHQEFVPVELS